ncbi:MAG TPA: OB-fold domain-containing protein [Acidimicrobiales bacterium]
MTRPLPQLTPENEFFWTSGADGKLRFRRCAVCGSLQHPPGPVCRTCGSDRLAPEPVTGTGVVVGFTVNEHSWTPSLPPPYVVAIVAIDEDLRVRLTTNLIDVPLSELAVGRRVEVRFEHVEDVWLPVFTLASDGPTESALPDEEPTAPYVRPMARADKFEDKVALTGIGKSRIGRRLGVDPLSLTVEAARNAVEDAGLTMADIDGLSTYPGGAAAGGHAEGGVTALEESLRIRPTWINGAPETPGQGGSVVAAMLAVAAGLCRHVLCFRTVWESTWAERVRQRPPTPGGGRVEGDMMAWRMPYGALSAANWIAMNASNHFHRYGTTRAALGAIAVNARRNAGLNPDAIYRDPMTLDDYYGARMITSPFGLYDCDVPCDGAIAVIVSAADTAGDLRRPPVLVDAVGTQVIDRISWDQGTLHHEPQTQGPAAHLWTRSSLRPSDVDVAELYDGFTFNCLSWIEALGFCETGEAGEFLADPGRIALDGELPLNTFGGQLSAGRTHGYGFIHEAVVQLRGDGGDRQVAGAEVVVVSTGGGTPGGCFLFTTAR